MLSEDELAQYKPLQERVRILINKIETHGKKIIDENIYGSEIQTETRVEVRYDDNNNDNNNNNNNRDNNRSTQWIERIYSFGVESLSACDLYTDYLILRELYKDKHQWWSSFTILTMIAPYLVCYAVLGSIFHQYISDLTSNKAIEPVKVEKGRQKSISKLKSKLKWLGTHLISFFYLLWMSPVSIIYFILIDAFFIFYILCNSTLLICLYVISALSYSICRCSVGRCIRYVEEKMDKITNAVFLTLFKMNKAQTIGYRRMRTLSQVCYKHNCLQVCIV